MNLYMLDVDGTLIKPLLHDGMGKDYDKVEVLPGRQSWVNQMVDSHIPVAFALITNQACVAMGYQTEDRVYDKMDRIMRILGLRRCPTTIHVAFEHPNALIDKYRGSRGMRKPGPGMLLEALKVHGVGKQDALFVGDMETDEQAALTARVPYRRAEEFFHGY